MTLRHGEVNSTQEIVKLNCRHQPRTPYLSVSGIALDLIGISENLLHMTRTAVAFLRQMRADCLTVRMCPHARSGQPAWPPRSRRSFLCRSVIVRKSGRLRKKKTTVTLAWHVRDVPTNRYTGKRERSRTTKDALLTGRLCRLPADNEKKTMERFRHRWHQWTTVTVRFGKLWIFMMMSYWVAIGARTANKLSPPCLKGNALPILKTLPGFLDLRLQVNDGGKKTVPIAAFFVCLFPWEKTNNNLLKSPPLSIGTTA